MTGTYLQIKGEGIPQKTRVLSLFLLVESAITLLTKILTRIII